MTGSREQAAVCLFARHIPPHTAGYKRVPALRLQKNGLYGDCQGSDTRFRARVYQGRSVSSGPLVLRIGIPCVDEQLLTTDRRRDNRAGQKPNAKGKSS